MRIISTRIHGVLDYIVGGLLILLPWLFDFADGGPEQWILVILGAGTIAYSLLTKYEYSVVKLIPMPVHLGIDLVAGAFLAVSPWLFGFADDIYWPHLVFGLLEILVVVLTRQRATYEFDRDDYTAGSRSQI